MKRLIKKLAPIRLSLTYFIFFIEGLQITKVNQ